MTEQIIQSLILPSLEFGAPEDMYVRVDRSTAFTLLKERRIVFQPGGSASFDTFFNGITVKIWKEQCALRDLRLRLVGSGRFILRFGLHRMLRSMVWLEEIELDLGASDPDGIPLPFWEELTNGILFLSLTSLDGGEIQGGEFFITSPPVRVVKLGIVITHFNRKNYVLPAIERIKREILFDPRYRDHIELIVVDNSRTIAADEAQGITLIPNHNLGGSGGFSRGLLYLDQNGESTHCLFMDDDASCEIESIKRTFALLSNAVSETLAISGSLLREVESYLLVEKGAKFHEVTEALHGDFDMRNLESLVRVELEDQKASYGAWWFFAFCIREVKHYPFPFFVRGDDIQFSLMNKFDIRTMNGIACWGEDFALKAGPVPTYFDIRHILLQNLSITRSRPRNTAVMLYRMMKALLYSYRYASAAAMTAAITDFIKGPEFWIDNIDTADIRVKISALEPSEKHHPIDRSDYEIYYRLPLESRLRRLVRAITLNGNLLPLFLIRDATAFQHKDFGAKAKEVFRFRRILYEHEPTRTGYVATYDKRRFFSEIRDFGVQLFRLTRRYPALQKAYDNALSKYTTRQFWEKLYATQDHTDQGGGPG